MGMDYTIYENWYKYMSNVLNQIQSYSDNSGQSYLGQVSSSNQSFADTYLNTMLRLNALYNTESSQNTSNTSLNTTSVKSTTGSQSMDEIFKEAAERYDVPVNLLMAMGKAESGFDANAVSPAGAQGVMQLMPATAKSLGVDDPFDARSNIMGGAKYISQKLKQYNGNIDLALAAYNAGSGNVAKYGGVPPFKETQNYIKRIRGYMNSELTTGKTVEGKNAESDTQTGGISFGTGSTVQSSRGTQSSAFSFTQDTAQYFVEMMRLQMLSRVSSLTQGIGDTDSSSIFL